MDASQYITQQALRTFVQWGGARPANTVYFGGQGAQAMFIDGASNPVSGDTSPIRMPHPRVRGAWKLAGKTKSAPDLPSMTLVVHERHGAIPRQHMGLTCKFNLYEYAGECGSLADKLSGFDDYVLIYAGGEFNSNDLGGRSARESDDLLGSNLGVTLERIYPVGKIAFGEKAAADTTTAVLDIVYGNSVTCGDCGPANDGTSWIYAVTNGAVAARPNVLYSTNGGASFTSQAISSAANADVPVSIDVIGNLLMVTVLGSTASEIHWTEINPLTGAPSSSWSKVTTGFGNTNLARDVYQLLPNAVFFAADNGIIYKSTDITAGVTALSALGATPANVDFKRIHGDGNQTILAGGAAGNLYKSVNGGITWAAVTVAPTANEIAALWVFDEYRYLVGDASGGVFSTVNGGESWTTLTAAAPSATTIKDIVAATEEVIHISYLVSATPKLSTTWMGGECWTQRSPRILGLPTFDTGNKIAVPYTENAAVDANNIAIACTTGTTDGLIALGAAAIL